MKRPARKTCPGCRLDKAREMYSISRARKDGLQVYCKVCHIDRVALSCYKRIARQLEPA